MGGWLGGRARERAGGFGRKLLGCCDGWVGRGARARGQSLRISFLVTNEAEILDGARRAGVFRSTCFASVLLSLFLIRAS